MRILAMDILLTTLARFYGLAEDGAGHLVTINENKGARAAEGRGGGTAPGEADLLFFSLGTGQVVRRVELADVIADKERSKCRFLTRGLQGLVITDLGMDCVYVLDPATRGVTMFGGAGSGPGRCADTLHMHLHLLLHLYMHLLLHLYMHLHLHLLLQVLRPCGARRGQPGQHAGGRLEEPQALPPRPKRQLPNSGAWFVCF